MTVLKTITVGELRMRLLDELDALPDNAEVFFGAGDLSLRGLTDLGTAGEAQRVRIEFNEDYAVGGARSA